MTSSPLQPADIVTDPARRWERLMPITGILFALAVPGVFLLPAHADLEIYVHIWVLATLALFYFLSFKIRTSRNPVVEQVSQTRTLTGYQVASYQPEGGPVPSRGTPISTFFLGMAGMMAIVAEAQLLAATVTPYFQRYPTASVNIIMAAIGLTMAALCIALFSVTLLMRRSRPERVISGRPALYGSLTIFVVLFVIVTFLAFQVPRYIFIGPPAPWLKLLAFAQSQAERIDKDATLRSISARPPYGFSGPYSSKNIVLELHFTFNNTAGENIDVVMLDLDPPRLLSSTRNSSFRSFLEGDRELARFRERAATIKLSPREVYALTEEEGMAFGKEKNSAVSPDINIALDDNGQALFGVPTWWNIRYAANQVQGYPSLFLRVDSTTGMVIAREHWPEDLEKKATPVPAASPTVTP
jgi:hypothetical protein